MNGKHGIYNITLQVIVADAFIIGRGHVGAQRCNMSQHVLVVLPHVSQSQIAREM